MKKLQKQYNKIVEKYAKKFEKETGIEFYGWSDGIDSVAMFGNYFFGFKEIKFYVDNKIKFEWLDDWYWFILDYPYISLGKYCKIRTEYEYYLGFGEFVYKEFYKHLNEKIKK